MTDTVILTDENEKSAFSVMPEATPTGLSISCQHLGGFEIEIPIGNVSFENYPYGVVASFVCACGRSHAFQVQ